MRNPCCAYWGLVCALFAFLGCTTRAEFTETDASSVDAARPDAADRGIPCTTTANCDDGVYCNGSESCVAGFCAYEARICDDQIACTRDTCVEARSSCVHSAIDADGDGYGSSMCLDATGAALGIDCDDHDDNRYPGNLEVCDLQAHDEDCDTASIGTTDGDQDNAVDARCCNFEADGSRHCGDDCDDSHATVRPGATEVCNDLDDNCNGVADEALVFVDLYRDRDGDGQGVASMSRMACGLVSGFVLSDGDCDDTDISINDVQSEICDNKDNNCNGLIDQFDTPPARATTWYLDSDGDGFGASGVGRTTENCADPSTPTRRFSLLSSDCNDVNPGIRPGAEERCNAIDDDCNGRADFALASDGNREDDDGDGFADSSACNAENGIVGTDCDDRDPATAPGFPERCDGRDNNCNGRADENAQNRAWFPDHDGDSYGDPLGDVQVSCSGPLGYVARAGDCNDDANTGTDIHPTASELCNAVDDNCDGSIDNGAPTAMCNVQNATALCVRGTCDYTVCVSGAADCNAVRSDGCEVLLATNLENCGGCSRSCNNFPRVASAECASGVCRVIACEPSFENCDRHTSNGCEVDIGNDFRNCGSCNNACYSDANTYGYCAGSAAAAQCNAVCRQGFDNCDGQSNNGCEQSLSTPLHCGRCQNACPFASDPQMHLTRDAGCGQQGSAVDCYLAQNSCTTGYQDCNGGYNDGCETSINTVQNCGGCFRMCNQNAPHASSVTCTAGSCSPICSGGYLNCDVGDFNGCEVNSANSEQHCGACGRACGNTDLCSNGNCATPVPAFNAVAAGSDHSCVVVPGGNVYCWGRNDSQEVCGGCGNTQTAAGARQVVHGPGTPLSNISTVGVGDGFSCAMGNGSGNTPLCWGTNNRGQLGRNGGSPLGPAAVVGLPSSVSTVFDQLAVGAAHVCVVARDNVTADQVWCWGDNGYEQLGASSPSLSRSAMQVSLGQFSASPSSIRRLISGERFTCALGQDVLNQATIVCWGSLNGVVNGAPATLVFSANSGCAQGPGSGAPIQQNQFAAGRDHICFQTGMSASSIVCAGGNDYGQLGVGNTSAWSCPVVVTAFGPVNATTTVTMGDGFTCMSNGIAEVRCFGRNQVAQLGRAGVGSTLETMMSSPVDDDLEYPGTEIRSTTYSWTSGSGDHQCGSVMNGGNPVAICWGNNQWGALGTRLPLSTPNANEALAPTVVATAP